MDVPNDKAGFAASFVHSDGEIIGGDRAEGEGRTGALALRGKTGMWPAAQDMFLSIAHRFKPHEIYTTCIQADREQVVVGGMWRPCKALRKLSILSSQSLICKRTFID